MKKIDLNYALLILNAILLCLFVFSFVPAFNKTSRKIKTTAILNKNRINDVSEIIIKNNEVEVSIKKQGSFWLGKSNKSTDLWPADLQMVENILNSSCEVIKAYYVTSNIKDLSYFSLDEENSVDLCFYNNSGNCISKINFGKTNPLTNRIFFFSNSLNAVYEAETSVESFLNCDENFWVDPYIFPRCITNFSSIESETLLRHGKLCFIGNNSDYNEKKFFIGIKDLSNGSSIIFYAIRNEDGYIIRPNFQPDFVFTEEDKKILENIHYCYYLSDWTFESLKKQLR